LLVADDPLDDPALAGVLARQDQHLVTGAQVRDARVAAGLGGWCHQSTSGASEMIFM
jgi:hypothetical protein